MVPRPPRRGTAHLVAAAVLTGALVVGAPPSSAGTVQVSSPTSQETMDAAPWANAAVETSWIWPASPFRWVQPYVQPADRYSAGHRGVDVRPVAGDGVRSPADGTVAFAGAVAGRGVLTIAHDGGLVTTLEPVETTLRAGDPVTQGQTVATLATGGHVPAGVLHFGVRRNGEYVNPLLLFGGVPRAVLLPCC